jgi:citrate synthase
MATKQKTEDQTEGASVDGASADGASLSVTDNRTGQTYELEVTDGTIRAMDLRQIKVSEDDFGLMAYDPAFTNTASCRSAITYIDGEAGILQHRGIPIEQLCKQSTFLEVAYLLVFGELPTQPQLERWVFDVTHHTFVHEDIKNLFETFRYDALHLLSGRQADRRSGAALHGGDPADRQDADPRRLRLPPQHGSALRVSG